MSLSLLVIVGNSIRRKNTLKGEKVSSSIMILILSVSTFLGALGLIALLRGVKTGQFDDRSKF